ncbi:hypothetical protein L1987_68385 [Smallanthus sonchifolius]|uniref:Uncharacterized protein n=1 Tax=Smallanthus sonchifolius TaxID=185202 RepID=A0ACB9B546_9ASTR|nr:hypothetical protein L1987_68385 [Smallanthus sonchifolius]
MYKMDHKKSRSMIHVPFSWETIPGVPKLIALPMRALAPGLTGNHREAQRKTALPLPPGSSRQPARSASKRALLSEEDPFVAAMIECTKDCDKGKGEIKKGFGARVRMNKSFLQSCKHSFDVVEGHLLTRPSSVGSIVRREQAGCLKLI